MCDDPFAAAFGQNGKLLARWSVVCHLDDHFRTKPRGKAGVLEMVCAFAAIALKGFSSLGVFSNQGVDYFGKRESGLGGRRGRSLRNHLHRCQYDKDSEKWKILLSAYHHWHVFPASECGPPCASRSISKKREVSRTARRDLLCVPGSGVFPGD